MAVDIFVFGSNLGGRHGKGAALHAKKYYGAKYGVGVGLTGSSYAIPTKDAQLNTLPLHIIKQYVDQFIQYATANSSMTFLVTRIGCGLAGYTDSDIRPMFQNVPSNCKLPEGW